MPKIKYRLVLPIIPEPKPGTASVISPSGFDGPVFMGSGDTDLLCGSCSTVIAHGMVAGQMQDLVVKCKECSAYCAILDIPKLESFVLKLNKAGIPTEKVPVFQSLIRSAIENDTSSEELAVQIVKEIPQLDWIEDYLVPSNAGDVYAFLAFVLALLTWYQGRDKKPEKVVIKNYFKGTNASSKVKRNDKCPCGSGRKYRKCHGSKKSRN